MSTSASPSGLDEGDAATSQSGTATPKGPLVVATPKAGYARFPRPRRKGLPSSTSAATAVSNLVSLLPPSPIKDRTLRAVSGGGDDSFIASTESVLLDREYQSDASAVELSPVSQLQLISSQEDAGERNQHQHLVKRGSARIRAGNPVIEDENPWQDMTVPASMQSEEEEVLSMLDSMSQSGPSASRRRPLAHQRGYSEPSLAVQPPSSIRRLAAAFDERERQSRRSPLPASASHPTTLYTHHQQSTSSHFSGALSSSSSRTSSPFSPGSRRWDVSPTSPWPPTPLDRSADPSFFPGPRAGLGSTDSIEYRTEQALLRRPRPGRMMTDYTMATSVGSNDDAVHGEKPPHQAEDATLRTLDSPIKVTSPGQSQEEQQNEQPAEPSKVSKASNLIRLFEHGLVLDEGRQEALAPPATLSSSRAASSCYSATVRPRLLRATDMLGVGSLNSPSPVEAAFGSTEKAGTSTGEAKRRPTPPSRSSSPKHRWASRSALAPLAAGLVRPWSTGAEGSEGSASRKAQSEGGLASAYGSPQSSRKGSLPLTDLVPKMTTTVESLEAKLRSKEVSASPHSPLSGKGGGTVASLRRSTQEGDLPSSPETAVSMVRDPHAMPLQAGQLYYYDVHRAAPSEPAWVAAQAVLFEGALALSWCPEEGGRENVVFELDKCGQVHSLPSLERTGGSDGEDDVRGSMQAKEQGLLKLKPFQLVFEDGVERFAADSIRERAQWVGRSRDALAGRGAASAPATVETSRSLTPTRSFTAGQISSEAAEQSTSTQLQRIGKAWRDTEETSSSPRAASVGATSVAPTLPPKDTRALTPVTTRRPQPAAVRVARPHASAPPEGLAGSIRPSLSLLPASPSPRSIRDVCAEAPHERSSHLSSPLPDDGGGVSPRRSPLARSEAAFAFSGGEEEDIFPWDSASQRPARSDIDGGDKIELPEVLSGLQRRQQHTSPLKPDQLLAESQPFLPSRVGSPSRTLSTAAQSLREQNLGDVPQRPASPAKLGTVLEKAPVPPSSSSPTTPRSGGKVSSLAQRMSMASERAGTPILEGVRAPIASRTTSSPAPSPSPSMLKRSLQPRTISFDPPPTYPAQSLEPSRRGEHGHSALSDTASSFTELDKVLEHLSREQEQIRATNQRSRADAARNSTLHSHLQTPGGIAPMLADQRDSGPAVKKARPQQHLSQDSLPTKSRSAAASAPASEAHINEIKERLDRLLGLVEEVHQRSTSSKQSRETAVPKRRASSELALSAIGADIKQLLRKMEEKQTSPQASHSSSGEPIGPSPEYAASREPQAAARSSAGKPLPHRRGAPSSVAQSYVSAASTAKPATAAQRPQPHYPYAAAMQRRHIDSPRRDSQETVDMEAAVRRQRSRRQQGVDRESAPPLSPADAAAHVAGGWYTAGPLRRSAPPRGAAPPPSASGRQVSQAGSVLAHMPMAQPVPASEDEANDLPSVQSAEAADARPAAPSVAPSAKSAASAPADNAAAISKLTHLVVESLREQSEGRRAEREQQSDIARYLNELNKWLEQDVEERNKDFKTLQDGVRTLASDLAGIKAGAKSTDLLGRRADGEMESVEELSGAMPEVKQAQRSAPSPTPDSIPAAPVQTTNAATSSPEPQQGASREAPAVTTSDSRPPAATQRDNTAAPAPAPASPQALAPSPVPGTSRDAPSARSSSSAPGKTHRSHSLKARLLETAQDEIKRHISAHHRFGRPTSPTGGSAGTLKENHIKDILEAVGSEDHKRLRKVVKEAAMAGAGALAVRLLEEHFKDKEQDEPPQEAHAVGEDGQQQVPVTTTADAPEPDRPTSAGLAPRPTGSKPVMEQAAAPAADAVSPPAEAVADAPAKKAPGPAPTTAPAPTAAAPAEPPATVAAAAPAPTDGRDLTEGAFATATRAEMTAGMTSILSTLGEVLAHLKSSQDESDRLRRESEERRTEQQEREAAWKEELSQQQERHAAAIVAAVTEHLAAREKERVEADAAKEKALDPKTAIEALVGALNEARLAEAARRQQTDASIAELATSVVRGVEEQHARLLTSLTALSRDVVCTSVENHLQHFKGAMASSFAGSAQAMANAWTQHAETVAKTPRATLMGPAPPAPAQAPPAPAQAPAQAPPQPPPPRSNGGSAPRPRRAPPLGPYGLPSR
ncbi:hypothetical protein BDZ90DRAFT_15522 [Jaminaea rosea]|uniref:PH domain-containing protein n=1 Tax=Jaminaea rosea TaxID=1569628 RepID=A0A316UYX2_9BASI|nr:hypothetical protein BDZ90DRAFT_15522 [Jaminaea rosea]PWN30489.1 hypothetical protein BDZ90DRAFT_15522 [Jaminaea rosea]